MLRNSSLRYWAVFEFAFLSCVPLLLSLILLFRFNLPFDAIFAHCRLIIVFIIEIYLLRFLLSRYLSEKRTYRLISTLLCSVFFVCQIIYYALVLISLSNWNRIITADIVRVYLTQFAEFLQVANISPVVAGTIAFTCVSLTFYFWWLTIRLGDWIWTRSKGNINNVAICSLLIIEIFCVKDTLAFINGDFAAVGEPISVTFFPELAKKGFQSIYVEQTALIQHDEKAHFARVNFKATNSAVRKNVVLIVADALRPDHMSVYNYQRKTTPNIDKLVKQNGVYQSFEMHSVCNESSCGLFALTSSKNLHEFSTKPLTLQEVLRKNGYTIRMILSGDHTNFYGLRDIYGVVDDYFDGSMQKEYYLNDDAILLNYSKDLPRWSGKPEFIQYHLMATHGMGKKKLPSNDYLDQINYYSSNIGVENINDKTLKSAVNFYDSGVWTADFYINEILTILRSKSYLQNAIVVITSDHGELLGEGNGFGHSKSVNQAVLKIPFIVLEFGATDERRTLKKFDNIQSQIDIAPSILRELGITKPSVWSGKQIQDQETHDFVYFRSSNESGFFDLKNSEGAIKYWQSFLTKESYAYKIMSDSGEKNNLYPSATFDQKKRWQLQLP